MNPNIVFVQDMITDDQIDPSKRNLIILDDLMDESKDSGVLSKLFTEGSHHRNISVVF